MTPEFQKILSELLDGQLSDAARLRLAELLRNDPLVLEWYASHMALHALLHLDFGDGKLQQLPPILRKVSDVALFSQESNKAIYRDAGEKLGGLQPAMGRLKPKFLEKWPRPIWIALAASILLTVAGLMLFRDALGLATDLANIPQDSRLNGQEKETAEDKFSQNEMRSVAVLGQASRVSWSDSHLPTEIGASLEPGEFKLNQGLIQIEFFSGASVIIEGPAEFELVSPTRIICNLGKIRAHVPAQAKGFTIATPTYAAVDLGTEFTVQVEQTGESQFQVLDGEVELWNGSSPESTLAQRLIKGQGIRSNPDGKLSELGMVASRFVGRKQMLEMATVAMQERFEKWKRFSQRMRSEPSVLLYYGFDGHAPWDRVLHNDKPGGADTLDGAIVGCQWTTGRWAGKQALEFKRTSDRVRLNVPGEYKSVTFAAWLRLEGFERWLSSLMLTDGHEPGEVHWQLTDLGQLMLGVKAEADHSHDYYSPSIIGPLDLGRWVHLACVYNGDQHYVSHYLDGVEVSRESVRRDTILRIGTAEIGNWVPQDLKDYRIRSLNGRVDEFILFNRALTPDEITNIYDGGKPQS